MDGKRSIPPSLIGLVIFIAIQIGGFALLWGKDTPPPEYVYLPATADKTAADSSANTPVVVVSPPDEKALREIIRIVLEQELAPYARQLATTAGAASKTALIDTPTVKENSPENIQALTTITGVVSNALAQGKWTTTDFAAVLPYAHQLTDDQRIKFINEIANAVNRQELELETTFPLF
jgi:hypothetical protein